MNTGFQHGRWADSTLQKQGRCRNPRNSRSCVLTAAYQARLASAIDVEAMASFMGRAGAGTGAASRALDPLRSRLRPAGSQRTYLSISHLRSLHIELVALLYAAGATSATPSPSSSGDAPSLSARQNRRLVEILRSIAELVREGAPPIFQKRRNKVAVCVCVRTHQRASYTTRSCVRVMGVYRGLRCCRVVLRSVHFVAYRLSTRQNSFPLCMLGCVGDARSPSVTTRACLTRRFFGTQFGSRA